MPQPKKHITALSLGAGYGSVGLSLLLEREELPGFSKPDLAVFADTMSEPPHVYDTLEWIKGQVSWPIVTVSLGNLLDNTWKAIRREAIPDRGMKAEKGFMDIPLFGDGGGFTRRQCTTHYKIEPVKKAYYEFTGTRPPALTVTQYLGISTDEASRMKEAKEKFLTNVYPLVKHGVRRSDIVAMMEKDYPEAPIGRSACFFCPYHGMAEWKDIREKYPDLYAESVKMERALIAREGGPFYLYKGKYGLGLEASMARADMQGTMDFEPDQFTNECEGHCGV